MFDTNNVKSFPEILRQLQWNFINVMEKIENKIIKTFCTLFIMNGELGIIIYINEA